MSYKNHPVGRGNLERRMELCRRGGSSRFDWMGDWDGPKRTKLRSDKYKSKRKGK